jgi:hypothetical protein
VRNTAGTSNTASARNTAGVINTAGASRSDAVGAGGMLLALALQGARNMAGTDNNSFLTTYPGNPRDNLRMLEIRANMDAFATPPLPERALCGSNTVVLWRRRSKQKDEEIQALVLEMDALLKETVDKSVIIVDQKIELDRLRSLFNESTTVNVAPQLGVPAVQSEDTEMEVDVVVLNHVVKNATYGLVETVTTPLGRRRLSLMPPPLPTQQPLHVEETQDSLSFPPVDEVGQLQASNSELKNRIAALGEQYYQWKLAYILMVDKNRQMASEYKKIDNEYLENNSRRDFRLTSWAHIDKLFPWTPDEILMKELNKGLSIIDWRKLAWDYEHEMSAHNLRGDPSTPSVKLWPCPSKFVLDGMECAVCMNGFGPEGGFHLGSCEHIYHPMCLISFMVVRVRRLSTNVFTNYLD